MRPRWVIEAVRWLVVAVFTAVVWALSMDGITANDLVVETVLGVQCLIAVVSLDWINAGRRRE